LHSALIYSAHLLPINTLLDPSDSVLIWGADDKHLRVRGWGTHLLPHCVFVCIVRVSQRISDCTIAMSDARHNLPVPLWSVLMTSWVKNDQSVTHWAATKGVGNEHSCGRLLLSAARHDNGQTDWAQLHR